MEWKELEKMFNEKFNVTPYIEDYIIVEKSGKLKQFIFDTIIPEVLKTMLVYEWHWINPIIEKRKYANKIIKQKAKELYWIVL